MNARIRYHPPVAGAPSKSELVLSATYMMLLLPRPSLCRPPATLFSSAAPHRCRVLPSNCLRLRTGGMGVLCMAKERRVRMVAKQIRRELSDMLLTDKVLQYAILPEASLGADRYLSSITTISDVEVSGDLQVVKVYVSVFGDERGKEVAIAGLKSKVKYVRSELGRRMKLRLTPEIRFIEDESLERGSRVIAILDRLKDERKDSESQVTEPSEQSNSLEDDGDWDKDDTDEGVIYIN